MSSTDIETLTNDLSSLSGLGDKGKKVKEPVAEAVVQEPVAEAVVQEPVAEAVVQEPVGEPVVKEPVAEAVVKEPVVKEPVVKEPVVEPTPVIRNRGTGAGGANTNVNGKSFEEKTQNETRLLSNGFIRKTIIPDNKAKYNYYFEKIIDKNNSIIYLTQDGVKLYFKNKLKKELFRKADEVYLFRNGDKYIMKILEKKNQNGGGSVEDKLGLGGYFIKEYSNCLDENFKVEYAFCLSSYLKKQYNNEDGKFKVMRQIHKEENITVLFGEDIDYYEKLDKWINSESTAHSS